MWKIRNIRAKNIVSFKSLEYTICQGVATLIFGENLDGTNQRHNGSGKSALIEAISLAITGDYLRDIKTTEELINDDANTCTVEICLTNDFNKCLFTIKRTVSRKDAQVIECHQYDKNGDEINTNKTIQPSVNDYNKFILNEIGLTKDDIYSNYILCRNRYVSFLSAKDKDKKELINRFSNGIMVDESIEALVADMEPVQEEVNEQHDEVVRYNARIETINEQLTNAELNKERALQTKAEKIKGLEERIAQKRAEIREINETINKSNDRLDLIDGVGNDFEELEKSDKPLQDCYKIISEMLGQHNLQPIADYSERLKTLVETCESKSNQLKSLESKLDAAKKSCEAINERYNEICQEHGDLASECERDKKKYQDNIENAAKKLESISQSIEEHHKDIEWHRSLKIELMSAIGAAKVRLNGFITCPKCGHQFEIGDDTSIDEVKVDIDKKEEQLRITDEHIESGNIDVEQLETSRLNYKNQQSEDAESIRAIEDKVVEHYRLVDEVYRAVRSEEYAFGQIQMSIENLTKEIVYANEQINNCSKSMFDDALDVIDTAIKKGEDYVDSLIDKRKYAKESIAQYEESIEELKKPDYDDGQADLKRSLKNYQTKLLEAENILTDTTAQLNELKMQKNHFMQFKTFLANTKIDAIGSIINSFLEEIGSDIRVSIDGYRVLKSGKISEKITINLLRNGVECGVFGKFSGGERSRVELASILAIQTLINAGCDDGKGLDFIALDEVLEACDYEGIMAACDTLNKLHKTALVITQNSVAENYPHQLVITKQNGISTIQ